MARGDHLKVTRFGYTHHGIDCGDGTVIHYAGVDAEKHRPVIRRTTLHEFARGGCVRVARRAGPAGEAAAARAEARLGESRYDLFWNNCEHFARWCVTGRSVSRQAARALGLGAGLALVTGSAVLYGLRELRRTRRGY